ncbi:54S ribosomal protein L23, mitochondrial [Clydaea vesicula]|uniref:54S ribosomal protein L23, mitochondrial n=1 Tax=Clydaea vesicula TaxID=447962 RepID=A0AAD5TXZ2_9FUNG|nr:54S ribosomal protein L23, mitochondrial [Clydaea vesicula]
MNKGTGLQYTRVFHLVDAKDKILGKLAARISIALRGKYKPFFNPAVDHGDFVVVINARHVALTGNKGAQKTYRWHSGYMGGLKEVKYPEFVLKHPTAPIERAVYGMLPKNNLRKVFMNRLKVFPDEDHPYTANILKHHDVEYERLLEKISKQENSPNINKSTKKITGM